MVDNFKDSFEMHKRIIKYSLFSSLKCFSGELLLMEKQELLKFVFDSGMSNWKFFLSTALITFRLS